MGTGTRLVATFKRTLPVLCCFFLVKAEVAVQGFFTEFPNNKSHENPFKRFFGYLKRAEGQTDETAGGSEHTPTGNNIES